MSHKYSGCYCQIDDELTHIVQMDYLGNGVWKCPKCGDVQNCHDVVFSMRLQFQRPTEKNNYCRVKIISPYDERLDKPIPCEGTKMITTLKELIQDEFCENEFEGEHKLGIFDVDLLYSPYQLVSSSGTEYDLDIDIIREKQVLDKKRGLKN